MGIYRKGKLYWMTKQYKGQKIEKSLYTTIKRVAEERYSKIVAEIIGGSYFNNQQKQRTLNEMIERYKTEYTAHKDYYQKARDISIFKHINAYYKNADVSIAEIENSVGGYEHFRRLDKAAPATIHKELSLFRRLFNIARKQWKWKIQNPLSDITFPKVSNNRVRYLCESEHKALFEALKTAEPWLLPVVEVALNTGLRLANVCNLQWSEVNLKNNIITIAGEKMKSNDYLGIPITDRVKNILLSVNKVRSITDSVFIVNGKPLYFVQVQRAFQKVLKQAGITNFRFHDLRHHFCSTLRQQGIDLHTISVLAGHRDERMTRRYAHLNVEALRDAVNKLETTTISLQQGILKSAKSL